MESPHYKSLGYGLFGVSKEEWEAHSSMISEANSRRQKSLADAIQSALAAGRTMAEIEDMRTRGDCAVCLICGDETLDGFCGCDNYPQGTSDSNIVADNPIKALPVAS